MTINERYYRGFSRTISLLSKDETPKDNFPSAIPFVSISWWVVGGKLKQSFIAREVSVFVLKMALETGPSFPFLSAASTNEGPCASFSNSARMPLIFLMGIYVKKKIYEPQRTRRRRKNKDLLWLCSSCCRVGNWDVGSESKILANCFDWYARKTDKSRWLIWTKHALHKKAGKKMSHFLKYWNGMKSRNLSWFFWLDWGMKMKQILGISIL